MDLVCYDCGSRYESGKRCSCGEPLWFETGELDAVTTDRPGIWRFAPLLPVAPEVDGLGGAAGDTPLVRTPSLDEYAGCRLSVKTEAENPTGSFKDRGSAVAAAAGTGTLGTVSHGNMAMSTAAFATAAGRECVVLVPEDISEQRLAAIGQYGPRILRIQGDYGDLYYETLALDTDIEFVNSDTPLRVAGQKTTAMELVLENPDLDAICLPVSSGGHASAAWKGLRELREAGVIDDVPRLYLAQAAACDPIAQAYREGRDVESIDPGETVAYSIANPDPPSGNRALSAVRETGGAVVSVDDEAIREAQDLLARRAGLCVEAASAVPLAGLSALAAESEIDADEEVAMVATGTGFKELGGAEPDAPLVELSALADALGT